MAEEKLRKKAEHASINPSGSNTAEESSDKRSPVDPSDHLCHNIEDFVSEVKRAMEESICKVASCEESSWSKVWKTMCSLVAKEMLKTLESKMTHSQPENTKDLKEKQNESESDTEALAGKIIVVVLDVLDGNSAERTDNKISDLLTATAERLIQTAATSDVEKSVFVDYRKQKVHLPPEELQTKASRAVSQLLLSSTGVLDMSSSSPEMPSSLASETDLDSMLEAMARSGFPPDLMRSHLDATSRDIVNMIQGQIKHVHCPRSSDTAKDSVFIFQRINEKVKMFFKGFKQITKKRSTELQQNTVPSSSASQSSPIEDLQTEDSQIPPRTQADIDSCTDDIIYNVLDLYKKEVQLVESRSPDERKVIKSASLSSSDHNDEGVLEKQRTHEFSSADVLPVLYQPEVNTSTLSTEGFLTKAIQVVSDILVKSESQQVSICASTSSKSSSRDLYSAAVDVAGIIVDALDELVESNVITSKSDSDTIIRSLVALPVEPSTNVLRTSDVSVRGSHLAPLNFFERVRGYLQAFFMPSFERQTTCSTQGDLQLARVQSASHMDDLTVKCTNSIISEVVHLYDSEVSPECRAPTGDEDSLEMNDIFQGLGELARSSRSSSKPNASGRDLGECKNRPFPELDSDFKDTVLDCTPSHRSVESLFNAQFQSKATQTVGEILLKSAEKLSASSFTQSLKSSSSSTVIQPSVVASTLSIQAQSTASDIIRSFLKYLQKCCSSKRKESAPSASHSIYRRVQKKVFGFLLGLQTSFSETSRISTQDQPTEGVELESEGVVTVRTPPHITSERIQIHLDSCTNEVIGKVVELYKSEQLVSSSSEVPLHISPSLPEQPFRLKTVKTKSFLTDAVKVVSDVLVTKASSQSSSLFLDSSRQTSSSPIMSTASNDLQNAALTIAEEVVDALDRYAESMHSAMATMNSTCEILSCLDAVSHISVSSIPRKPDTSERMAYSEPFFIFRKVKNLLNHFFMDAKTEKTSERIQSTPTTSHHSISTISRKTPSSSLCAVSERTADPEYDIVQKSDSAAETVAVPQPQSLRQMNQLQHLISDETIRCHADRLINFEVLRYIKEPSYIWKCSSDSVLETSWVRNNLLRDPVQVPSSLVHACVDESVKTLLLHLLSLNSASSRAADQELRAGTSAGSKGQERHSDKSAGSQCSDAESRLTKVLTDSQSRIEDSLSLLVDSGQTKPQRSHDVSLLDFNSPAVLPTTSSRADNKMMKATLDNSISSQDYETYSSSSKPLNEHRSSDPNPVAVKKSDRGFRFIACKKAPIFSPGGKMSNKIFPADMMSDHQQSTSSSGNLPKSSQRESAFRKTRQRLCRIFTAIRKALPNPFCCTTQSS